MTGTIMTCAVLAQMLVRPWSQANAPLAERVASDFRDKAHAEAFVHYAVPLASDIQRLPDVYPTDGRAGAPVRIVAAKVRVGMSDADVKDICENHLSTFVNVRQIVARLRSAWVVERLTADGR